MHTHASATANVAPSPINARPRVFRAKPYRALADHGQAMINLGYNIIPILPGKKSPGFKEWQKTIATKAKLAAWLSESRYRNGGIGVLAGNVCAIDIDCMVPEVADRIAAMAKERFGFDLYRVGQSPKLLIPCRTDEPFVKITSDEYNTDRQRNGLKCQVEVLGEGQQFVAYGIHKHTRNPYTWHGGELYETDPDALPLLTREEAQAFIDAVNEVLAAEPELVRVGGSGNGTQPCSQGEVDDLDTIKNPLDVSEWEIKDTLNRLNPSSMTYDSWCDVGMALHHQYDGSDEGFQRWIAWAEDGGRNPKFTDGEYSEADYRYKYDSFKTTQDGRRPTTFATLIRWAHDGTFAHDESRKQEPPGVEPDDGRIPDPRHLCTDQANANRLEKALGGNLIVCAGQWYRWCGTHWAKDQSEVARDTMTLSRMISAEVKDYERRAAEAKTDDEAEALKEIAKKLKSWSSKSEMKHKIDAARGLLKEVLDQPASKLDADPWLLNCRNGTVDLRTGALKEHDPSDFITKRIDIDYDPDATAPKFAKAVRQIFRNDDDLVAFIQRWFGYCATGSTQEQKFAVHWGGGANGKSLLIATIEAVLKPYVAAAPPNLMVASRNDSSANDIADMFGKRMITSHESGEGRQLKEDMIKQVTGSDTLKGCFKYKDYFEFRPTHKLQMLTNHKPSIAGTDVGMWRRVMLIPYTVRFGTKEEVNKGLAQAVRRDDLLEQLVAEELPGVLRWIVDGAKEWFAVDLNPPKAVIKATDSYRSDEDRIGQFIEECCVIHENMKIRLSGSNSGVDVGLYNVYREWCKDSGFHALGKGKFANQLDSRPGIEKRTAGKNQMYIFGINAQDGWRKATQYAGY